MFAKKKKPVAKVVSPAPSPVLAPSESLEGTDDRASFSFPGLHALSLPLSALIPPFILHSQVLLLAMCLLER